MANIVITLGGIVLPVPTKFIQISGQNATDNRTLDGTLYTDYINVNRSWDVSWNNLCEDDYNDLYAIFFDQFSSLTYPTLSVPYYGISVPVKVSINEKDIFWDGNQIKGIEVTLLEQYAIS
jgi:hypothetical protein